MGSLEAQYVAAHQKWQKSGKAEVWEAVVNDGLNDFQSGKE